MSLVFNDISTFKGLVQLYEKEIGANQGDISGNSTKLKEFAADANLALDDYFSIALPVSGTWQLDDSNQTDYPIITTNIVSGQRDYSFTTDQQSNLILDIYKVIVLSSATATIYLEIDPADETIETSLIDGSNIAAVPSRYAKMANGIFLDPIPNYNATAGLKVVINREASYFTSADTTKKPGVPGLHHKYFYLKPAMEYARRNNLTNQDRITAEVLKMERDTIPEYFGGRSRDEHRVLKTKSINYI